MESYNALVTTLFEQECFLIEALPEQMPAETGCHPVEGDKFQREQDAARAARTMKFTNLLLNLTCFCDVAAFREEWVDHPDANWIGHAIDDVQQDRVRRVLFLFPEEEMLLVADAEDPNLLVFGPSESMQKILSLLTTAEGLSWHP